MGIRKRLVIGVGLLAAGWALADDTIVEPAIECSVLTPYPWHDTHARWIILHLPSGDTITARLGECHTALQPIPEKEG